MKPILYAAIAVCAMTAGKAVAADCTVYDLRTEHLDNPVGIDAAKPRFSWKIQDSRKNAVQKAYQLQIASTTATLQAGQADIWDSGKQETSASTGIVYGGPPLKPRTPYVWQVKAWDLEGKETPYSSPATWETGMMTRDQWKAQWISGDAGAPAPQDDFHDVSWIWYPEGDPAKEVPKAERFFRLQLDLAGNSVVEAKGWATADDGATVYINGHKAATANGFLGLKTFDARKSLKTGENLVQVSAKNTGKGPAALAVCIDVKFADGETTRITTSAAWQASKTAEKGWPAKEGEKADWVAAKAIGPIGMAPWHKPTVEGVGQPASMFRKDFAAETAPKSARLYITALGSYRAEINGKRVGNDVLTPDWTDFDDRVMYQTYDVTGLVQSGQNAIGVTVGDGWYASALGWNLKRWHFGPPPTRFLAELHLDFGDGKKEVVVTDNSWKTAQSPILRSEIYYGESYDARQEQKGWSSAGFDAAKWSAVKTPDTSSSIELNSQASAPIRVTKTIEPVSITEPSEGAFVYDMGQNMVGWARLKVSGKAGDTVKLRFAEILNDDGTIYRDNLRSAEAVTLYTLKGEGEEVFEPHFTYYGFRYVEVTGFPGKPGKDAITGMVFHTDVKPAGKIVTSDAMVNKIVENTQWGIWGNLMSVPTDCPQRDERLGWTGDAQAIWQTAMYMMDMSAFTEKWARDLRDAQSEAGGYPNVAPRVVSMNDGAPAWGDAGVILPYQTWRAYGDVRLLAEMWDSMEQWMKFIHEENPDYLWMKRRGNDYGDWVPANSETDKDLIATAYWAGDARMMSEMATALGKPEKAAEYQGLYENIRKAFQAKFIKPDGKIANGSQTCYALALHYDLVQPDMVSKAVGHLVDDIHGRKDHLSTGFVGTTFLLPMLTKEGQNPLAITLLLNKTFPSWGYMIEKGATTIWERWNGDTGDPSMNSFNHYCYGSVVEWMYGYLAGIRSVEPGYKKMIIEPHPDPRVQSVDVTYESPQGPIVSNYKYNGTGDDAALAMTVSVPPNTTAVISLPAAEAGKVKLDGNAIPADLQPRVKDGRVVIDAGAGKYEFAITK